MRSIFRVPSRRTLFWMALRAAASSSRRRSRAYSRTSDSYRNDGAEFERECAAALRSAAWSVRETGRSGDQGADLIATKRGTYVVVQCKCYSRPVGNRAVQEAFSAQRMTGAPHAAVLGNSGYTASARQLAQVTGVKLLDITDAYHFDRLFDVVAGRTERSCPRCRSRLRIPLYKFGTVKCPRCGGRFFAVTWFR